MTQSTIPRVLTIAGSDSGGGAGIEADIKTFTALGVYGTAALTALTAQNTVGVTAVHDVPASFVAAQIDAVAEDIGVDAAKTGMLANADIVEAVACAVERHRIRELVVDPVMFAKSGDRLLEEEAEGVLIRRLLPLARVITPNIPEAEALSGVAIETERDIRIAAEALRTMGPDCILIKGGHLDAALVMDYLFDGDATQTFGAPRVDSKNTHGTGCTFSAAIAAYLAKGLGVSDAVQAAKEYVTQAIRRAFPLGAGHGPLNHFWPLGNT